MSKESLTRREFLKLAALAAATSAISGCVKKEPEQTVVTEHLELDIEFAKIILKSEWDYPIGFDSDKFFVIANELGLPLPGNKDVEVILTNKTTRYKTDYEIQSHLVTLSQDDSPDKIEISCGRYVEGVKDITGSYPSTCQDALFMSTALSESFLNGFADLSVAKGEIAAEEGNQIVESYLEKILSSPLDDTSYIFMDVYINGNKQKNYRV
jgi:hypothetical protein